MTTPAKRQLSEIEREAATAIQQFDSVPLTVMSVSHVTSCRSTIGRSFSNSSLIRSGRSAISTTTGRL